MFFFSYTWYRVFDFLAEDSVSEDDKKFYTLSHSLLILLVILSSEKSIRINSSASPSKFTRCFNNSKETVIILSLYTKCDNCFWRTCYSSMHYCRKFETDCIRFRDLAVNSKNRIYPFALFLTCFGFMRKYIVTRCHMNSISVLLIR